MARESAVAVSIRFIIITPDFIYIIRLCAPLKREARNQQNQGYISPTMAVNALELKAFFVKQA
ncbi:hypothetical protein HMPREF0454_02897 [Hafnia alvei ATCC 51873]|uniref:Uncharacterized protein n=1 Tax=Hafnia alvei ATCC 51873 TaxID=1002364 RepID=G9Y8I5_HAFAL|nr:hypothetical protein HMPREF0454_02897 [Hafnia alvei ATCC 51873]